MTTSLRPNEENEAVGAIRGGKGLTVAGDKGRVTRGRTALTEISNRPAAIQNKALKPSRGLVRQKATTLLSHRPVTRLSAEKNDEAQDVEMEDVAAAVVPAASAFSSHTLENVDNIDKDDVENPQLVVEYVNEIYAYLRQLETKQSVRPDYLNKAKSGTTILPKMRSVLVDWLIQVHQQFNLLQETLYLTVAILDRFLQDAAGNIERKQLQLVGVAAMFIASKYEEMYAPEIGDFVYITDRAYTESQIREMEMKILEALAFELGRPLPLHFLRRNSKAGNVDALTHTLAKYAMELTLVDYHMAHVKPSMVAAAALALSLKVFDQDDKPIRELWSPTLIHYTGLSFDVIASTVEKLADIVLTTSKGPENVKLGAVRKKYEDKKLSKIARLTELTGPGMEKMAKGDFS